MAIEIGIVGWRMSAAACVSGSNGEHEFLRKEITGRRRARRFLRASQACDGEPAGGRRRIAGLCAGGLRRRTRFESVAHALAERAVAAGEEQDSALVEEDVGKRGERVDYDWEREWYPLYLTREVPKDAPLALQVFDRSLVLFYDGDGTLNCLEDRCPHRLAKLSEGQIIDGKLECFYHGWQFQGDGACSKIPQLPEGSKIPRRACARSYTLKESQGVVWVWMAEKGTADDSKLPWFEHWAKDGFGDISTIHELPYDYSILLENLLDPAHVPISHDRTDPSAKREEAQPLSFQVLERSDRGFASFFTKARTPEIKTFVRFESPCTIRSDTALKDPKTGSDENFSVLLLCRPTGQGKAMLIARFGATNFHSRSPAMRFFPRWFIHITPCSVLEQDMRFLASQNEILSRENLPTRDLYLNLPNQDALVVEYRKWLDDVGHGMPYYWGHRTTSPAPRSALQETAPAGLFAFAASAYPSKGAVDLGMFAKDPTNRYYRHFVHCRSCRTAVNNFQKARKAALAAAVCAAGLAFTLFFPYNFWRVSLVVFALASCAASWVCSRALATLTQTYFRKHRYA